MSLANKKKVIIGVCGGTSSGKTTLAKKIHTKIEEFGMNALILSQDSFYRNLTEEQLALAAKNNYNFDHPHAIDFDLMKEVLINLIKSDAPANVPMYDFVTHQRLNECTQVGPAQVIIVEGIFIFSIPEIVDLMDIKLFVDVDDDTRLLRRINRDLSERNRGVEHILENYQKFVKPGFDNFIKPYKRVADLIIPNGGNNQIAIDMISRILF